MLRPPIAPMLAKLARELPGEGFVYEPKWDGFRALLFREGDRVELQSRHERPLARYFPEVVEAARALPTDEIVLDGELVVVGARGLDFAALMSRLHPSKTRVDRLRAETPAAFVAFDLLNAGEDLRSRPFEERRARLEAVLAGADSRIVATPATRDVARARAWLHDFEGGGLDGVVAKDPSLPYAPGQRSMIKVKRERTLDCVVAGFRLYGGQPVVGSLLLGVHEPDGRLVHVGVTSQFTDAQRRALIPELAPLVTRIEGHPWEHGFNLPRSPLGRLAGAAGRWTPGEMERDWIPLRPERVCEVAYDTLDDRRMRHPARFKRWRPDRKPASCGFDQILGGEADVRALLAS